MLFAPFAAKPTCLSSFILSVLFCINIRLTALCPPCLLRDICVKKSLPLRAPAKATADAPSSLQNNSASALSSLCSLL